MINAFIQGISFALPEQVVTNADLAEQNPSWDMPKIEEKVGIRTRHIANDDECASDLAFAAAEKLIVSMGIDRQKIDALLFCTQSPDYALPATACILQDRLRLPTACAAFDFNQGCSGYVYGLSLAKGMIAAGIAHNVLLLTGETYSKYIHDADRSVRVLFGDGGTATLISDEEKGAKIGEFILGTDGSGAMNLAVKAGGGRVPVSAASKVENTDNFGNVRTAENLFMNGQELFVFALKRVPEAVDAMLAKVKATRDQVKWFVFHQANAYMNETLRKKMGLPKDNVPLCLEEFGNTVSCTIPITLSAAGKQFQANDKVMLIGFGVGYSWGACVLDWGQVQLV